MRWRGVLAWGLCALASRTGNVIGWLLLAIPMIFWGVPVPAMAVALP